MGLIPFRWIRRQFILLLVCCTLIIAGYLLSFHYNDQFDKLLSVRQIDPIHNLNRYSVKQPPSSNVKANRTVSLPKQSTKPPNSKERKFQLTINHEGGRLGNKMFIYASLLGIAKKTERHPFVLPYLWKVDLEKVFNLTHVEHHSKDYIEGWKTVAEKAYATEDTGLYHLPQEDIRLWGCVQSWKYFYEIEDDIRREFTFNSDIRQHVENVFKNISSKYRGNRTPVFIGVHVRMPDEYSFENPLAAPVSFFLNAFQKMKSLLPDRDNLLFLVAGNNLTWCIENLKGENIFILEPADPEIHMAVLGNCDHMILSVGSYGWWAGWLTGGHVIYYKKFPQPGTHEYSGFTAEDYYPPGWIAVDD